MNSGEGTHPDEGRLVRYLDGELPEREMREIRQHLESCWNCRMYADRMQNAIVEYARYREMTGVPEPPAGWKDLSGDFRQVEHATPARMRWPRVSRVVWFAGVVSAAAATAWFTLPRETATRTDVPKMSIESRPIPRVAAPAAKPTRTIAIPQPRANLSDELAVIAQLHAIRADLGEPIEVVRSEDGRLVVSGSGLSPGREEMIQNAVRKIPGVSVRFSQPLSRAVDSSAPLDTMRPRPIAFEHGLLEFTGGRTALEGFSNAVLDASDRLSMHAQALRKLDARFGPADVAQLNEDGRRVLLGLEADHRRAAREAVEDLERMLDPVFSLVHAEAMPPGAAPLAELVLRLDRCLNAAFAGAVNTASDEQLYGYIRGLIVDIRKEMDSE